MLSSSLYLSSSLMHRVARNPAAGARGPAGAALRGCHVAWRCPFVGHYGVIMGSLWGHYGGCWGMLGVVWRLFGGSWGLFGPPPTHPPPPGPFGKLYFEISKGNSPGSTQLCECLSIRYENMQFLCFVLSSFALNHFSWA